MMRRNVRGQRMLAASAMILGLPGVALAQAVGAPKPWEIGMQAAYGPLKREQIDGTEQKQISFKAGQRELSFTGQDYLLNFSRPNFFFHVTTAYAIFRHCGVEVGKNDYLGTF